MLTTSVPAQGEQGKRGLSQGPLYQVSVPLGKSGHHRADPVNGKAQSGHLLKQKQSSTVRQDDSVHQQAKLVRLIVLPAVCGPNPRNSSVLAGGQNSSHLLVSIYVQQRNLQLNYLLWPSQFLCGLLGLPANSGEGMRQGLGSGSQPTGEQLCRRNAQLCVQGL